MGGEQDPNHNDEQTGSPVITHRKAVVVAVTLENANLVWLTWKMWGVVSVLRTRQNYYPK
jgi:hypothetical protein